MVSPRALLRTGALTLALLAWPFYTALATRTLPSDAPVGAGGRLRQPDQRLVRGASDRSLSDARAASAAWRWDSTSRSRRSAARRRSSPTSLIRSTGSDAAPACVMIAYGCLTLLASLGLPRLGGHVLASARLTDTLMRRC